MNRVSPWQVGWFRSAEVIPAFPLFPPFKKFKGLQNQEILLPNGGAVTGVNGSTSRNSFCRRVPLEEPVIESMNRVSSWQVEQFQSTEVTPASPLFPPFKKLQRLQNREILLPNGGAVTGVNGSTSSNSFCKREHLLTLLFHGQSASKSVQYCAYRSHDTLNGRLSRKALQSAGVAPHCKPY